uniref:Uncharacterized protein n=1 Tax=Lactuca sativa TaxID=4236 RepID=A0A9R1VMM2_LACSA|nr:hypothetical protein LSAT_V11C500249400 [Lactuca sativa]
MVKELHSILYIVLFLLWVLIKLSEFITNGIRVIDPRTVQRVEIAEQGFKEVCVELQQQIRIQGSLLTKKMQEMTTRNRELFSTFRKENGVGQGISYTPAPPGYHEGTNWRIKKLEIPLFNGNNSNGWHRWSLREITDPLDDGRENRREEAFLGFCKNGPKIDNWTETNTLGSHKPNQESDLFKGNSLKSIPILFKSVDHEENLNPPHEIESKIAISIPQSATLALFLTYETPLSTLNSNLEFPLNQTQNICQLGSFRSEINFAVSPKINHVPVNIQPVGYITTKEKSKCLGKKDDITSDKKQVVDGYPDKSLGYGKQSVGHRIKIWRPPDKMHCEGAISSYNPIDKQHKVSYVDGDDEVLNLCFEKWSIQDKSSPQEEKVSELPSPITTSSKHLKQKVKRKLEFSPKQEDNSNSPKRFSSETKPTKGDNIKDTIETSEQLKQAEGVTIKFEDELVVTGGDDSDTNTFLLSEYFRSKRLKNRVNWVLLEDGIGYLNKSLVSKSGRHVEGNPKGWRLFADFYGKCYFWYENLDSSLSLLCYPHLCCCCRRAISSCTYAGYRELFMGLLGFTEEEVCSTRWFSRNQTL